MRKFIVSAAAIAAILGGAAPASAQAWQAQPQIQNDINQLDRQISRAVQRKTVSQREAAGLRREAIQLQRTYNGYSRGGLDRQEIARLQRQVNRLQGRLQLERRDSNRRRG